MKAHQCMPVMGNHAWPFKYAGPMRNQLWNSSTGEPCMAACRPVWWQPYERYEQFPAINRHGHCCTCRTDIPVSDLALHSSHSRYLNHSHSSSFIPPFLFTAELIQCLRVSHLAWDVFYGHFKSPYSQLYVTGGPHLKATPTGPFLRAGTHGLLWVP